MPVAHANLLELLSQQDKITNRAKDIAGLMLGRRLVIPAGLGDDFDTYLSRCLDATAIASQGHRRAG